MLCLCSKTHCCFEDMSDKLNISSKGLYKPFVKDSGDGLISKNRRVLKEVVNLKLTNLGLRTVN